MVWADLVPLAPEPEPGIAPTHLPDSRRDIRPCARTSTQDVRSLPNVHSDPLPPYPRDLRFQPRHPAQSHSPTAPSPPSLLPRPPSSPPVHGIQGKSRPGPNSNRFRASNAQEPTSPGSPPSPPETSLGPQRNSRRSVSAAATVPPSHPSSLELRRMLPLTRASPGTRIVRAHWK